MKEKVLISGGTGLVGQRLVNMLDSEKYEISILTRGKSTQKGDVNYINWRPYDKNALIDTDLDFDHIINLTGAGIADKKWTKKRKKILLESRTKTTAALSSIVKRSTLKTYIGASAIGFYGDTGAELLTEESPAQSSFMSEICAKWEEAHQQYLERAKAHFILRIGIVISSLDGALPKIKASVPFGVAPYLGDGNQYYSWIHIDDLCQLMIDMMSANYTSGIYNAVSPNPVTNKTFMQDLKSAMGKIAIVAPVPKFMIKVMFGEMSTTVLNSNNVSAAKLSKAGFAFQFPKLKETIQDVLKRKI